MKTSISSKETELCRKGAVYPPRVLDYKTQVVVPSEYDSFLDVLRRSSIDADYWHAPLLTRNAERNVEVTALDRPVGKCVRLVVGVFGSTRLIRTPDAVVPARDDISAVSCGRVVARGGRWDRADQRLRDLRCEGLEFGIGWPTS